MFDISGEGWVKHILYGTSKIIQLRGPEAHLEGRGQSLFLAVRPFEICRSLIYSTPSFLSLPPWMALVENIFRRTQQHPKEAMFDIMFACSCLSER
jgi:hypothetical protein